MSLTHDDIPPPYGAAEFWTDQIEALSDQIRDCQRRSADGDGDLRLVPGIRLSKWLEMLQIDLLEAVVEREAARARREAEMPSGAADGGKIESLNDTLDRLRDLLPDIENPTVPDYARMTPEDEAAWAAEHRGAGGPWDTLSAEQRRKLQ